MKSENAKILRHPARSSCRERKEKRSTKFVQPIFFAIDPIGALPPQAPAPAPLQERALRDRPPPIRRRSARSPWALSGAGREGHELTIGRTVVKPPVCSTAGQRANRSMRAMRQARDAVEGRVSAIRPWNQRDGPESAATHPYIDSCGPRATQRSTVPRTMEGPRPFGLRVIKPHAAEINRWRIRANLRRLFAH